MKAFTVPTVFSAIDKFTAPLKNMQKSVSAFIKRSDEDVARFERRYRLLGNTASSVAKKSFIIGSAIAAPLALAAHNAIQFEDRMADVAKTTGLSGIGLDKFGKEILALAPSTRTSVEQLQQIAAIGGQMGVANSELLGFTDSVNKFNVALGSDFAGGVEGAARAISGLKGLFQETRNLKVDDAITRAGSAINALSAKGVVVPELTEFISRIGQLPDAIKPSIQSTAALGAVFNKSGLTAEIASRALADILLTGAQNLPAFAKQMKITSSEVSTLINTNPAEFANKFAQSLNGLDATGLAKTLKGLKITDSGAVKAVGALGSSTKMLAEFQSIANSEFKKGTSLLNEYNAKNETTQAKLLKAKNSAEAFSIILGQELLPIINSVLMKMLPVVKGFIEWTKNNPKTTKTIILLAASIAALSFIVSGVAGAVALYANIMLIASGETKVITAAQWLLNAAMSANPIGLIIIAIVALVAIIAAAIIHYDKWGAALLFVMGPLGMIVNLVMAFVRNWDMITQAFREGGILAGIKAIGAVLLDSVLMPIQQIVQLIAQITGADWASSAVKTIENYRKGLGVEVSAPAVNSRATEQQVAAERNESYKQQISLDITNRTGNKAALATNGDPLVTPNLKSTWNPASFGH